VTKENQVELENAIDDGIRKVLNYFFIG